MGTYRLVRKLASGGMAEVFLAKVVGAEGFEKPVAVKRILPSLSQDKEFIELFLREAKLTVSLQHANVVQVFGANVTGDTTITGTTSDVILAGSTFTGSVTPLTRKVPRSSRAK